MKTFIRKAVAFASIAPGMVACSTVSSLLRAAQSVHHSGRISHAASAVESISYLYQVQGRLYAKDGMFGPLLKGMPDDAAVEVALIMAGFFDHMARALGFEELATLARSEEFISLLEQDYKGPLIGQLRHMSADLMPGDELSSAVH